MKINTQRVNEFQKKIWDYYHLYGRKLPWRNIDNPYHIFISEIMLQQTQVARVLVKYPEFLAVFPTISQLAKSDVPTLLKTWQGMGYNRRALYLKNAAEIIVTRYQGKVPDNPVALDELPGIGYATACSITAFAFNKPTVFIETNIRRVFIHEFFTDESEIDDKQLMPLVEATVDHLNPREWYYALMDYGVYLAKQIENPNRRSKHYTLQSKFEGSDRQIRSRIVKELIKSGTIAEQDIISVADCDDTARVERIVGQLEKEGFLKKIKNGFVIE